MSDQILKDKNNTVIGKIRTVGGVMKIYNKHNTFLGSYDPKSNKTKNKNQTVIGTGNLLTTLL